MRFPKRLATLLSILALRSPIVGGTFQWDSDSLADCKEREEAGQCTRDATTFYQCPLACTKHKQAAGVRTQGEAEEPDEFFELSTPLSNDGKKRLTFDRFEGYVTLLCVIPLMPGMAQYYYDMMEHIHSVFPYTLEIVVFPVRREDHPDVQLKIPTSTTDKGKSKVVVLPELIREGDKIESNPVLEYLEKVLHPEKGFVFTDRVTTYIVSYNAGFVEKVASPKMDFLEKLVTHYLREMEWKREMHSGDRWQEEF